MNDNWLKAQQAAKMLGITMTTIKRIEPSELPYYRFGSRGDRKYRTQDVLSYIEKRMVRK